MMSFSTKQDLQQYYYYYYYALMMQSRFEWFIQSLGIVYKFSVRKNSFLFWFRQWISIKSLWGVLVPRSGAPVEEYLEADSWLSQQSIQFTFFCLCYKRRTSSSSSSFIAQFSAKSDPPSLLQVECCSFSLPNKFTCDEWRIHFCFCDTATRSLIHAGFISCQ